MTLLRQRDIPGTLHPGVARDETSTLKAHARLRWENAILTGRSGKDQITVMPTFADILQSVDSNRAGSLSL